MWTEIKHLLGFVDPPPLVPPSIPVPPQKDSADLAQRKGDMNRALARQQAQHRVLQRQARTNRTEAVEARHTLAELRSTLNEVMAPKPHDMLASMLDSMKPPEDGNRK